MIALKWEYKVTAELISGSVLEAELNRLGQLGWELVDYKTNEKGPDQLILKRPTALSPYAQRPPRMPAKIVPFSQDHPQNVVQVAPVPPLPDGSPDLVTESLQRHCQKKDPAVTVRRCNQATFLTEDLLGD